MSDQANPFAPPQAHVADVGVSGQPVQATRMSRFLAALVDVAIQVGVLMVVNLALPWSMFNPNAGFGMALVNGLIGFAIFLAINGVLLARQGQTVGKKLLGVRIVRTDGSRADAVRLIGLRYAVGFAITMLPFVGIVYGLLDCLFIFGSARRCIHDHIAGTIVVRA